MKQATAEIALAAVLAAGVVGTGIALVTTKHETRLLFQELQELQREQDRLQDEWSALQLEEGMLAAHARIDQKAREELGFVEPQADWIHLEPVP